ncbi:MAG: Phosphomannomutase, partial [uncultured Solirubrobacteraceae bacterium]
AGPSRDLQGLRHPRALRRAARRRRGGGHRPGVHPGRRAPGGQGAGGLPDRPGARHAADGTGARGSLPGGDHARGRGRGGRGAGRDGDALLPRRVPGARRRAHVHRLPQPRGLHGREARPPGRHPAQRRGGHPGHPPPHRGGAGRAGGGAARRGGGGRPLRGLRRAGAAVHRPGEGQAAAGGRGRRQRHGRPDGRAAARAPRARPRHDVLDAGRHLPRPRAQPAPAREPRLRHGEGRRGGRRPGDRLGRRRGPLLLHRRHGAVRRRRLPDGDPRRAPADEGAEPDGPLRRPGLPRGGRHRPHRGRGPPGQPRGPRLLQDAHAAGGLALRRRGLGPLLLPRLLLRGLRDDPRAAHPREALRGGGQAVRAARALPRDVLHLGRGELRGGRRGRPHGGDRGPLRQHGGRHRVARGRRLRRLRRLALQRAVLEHGAAPAPLPGVARLPGGHGGTARRAAGGDPGL